MPHLYRLLPVLAAPAALAQKPGDAMRHDEESAQPFDEIRLAGRAHGERCMEGTVVF